jgi:hypothetical protein
VVALLLTVLVLALVVSPALAGFDVGGGGGDLKPGVTDNLVGQYPLGMLRAETLD